MKQWQSGAVQDYALIYQVVVILGILALAYPATGFGVPGHLENLISGSPALGDPKFYTLALFLLCLVPSYPETGNPVPFFIFYVFFTFFKNGVLLKKNLLRKNF